MMATTEILVERATAMVHPSAIVEDGANVGPGTRVWRFAHVRAGAVIGADCILGKGVYVDHDVVVGDRVKLENGVSLYYGATLEDGVFVGPHACLTNDRLPRAITPTGDLKSADDWVVGRTTIRYGASIGAGAVIVTGVEIGRWAMVGAGAVVTRDVPDHALVLGVPGRVVGYVCRCGRRLAPSASSPSGSASWSCTPCEVTYLFPSLDQPDD